MSSYLGVEIRRMVVQRGDRHCEYCLTAMGEVTARILDFNGSERILERTAIRALGRFPRPQAIARMNA